MDAAHPLVAAGTRAFLVIAHPGHELRIHGWLETVRPHVFVLTDGSGRPGRSRLASTSRILAATGSQQGSIYGRFTDVALYDALLDGKHEAFQALTLDLADALGQMRPEYVVGDALEGYNPIHDVCRLIINVAVAICSRRGNPPVGNFDFPLVGRPDAAPLQPTAAVVRLRLEESQFARKLAAAHGYTELDHEIKSALRENSVDAFRDEWLRAVEGGGHTPPQLPPYYETYGERQVAAGYYSRVLRYREHVLPVVDTLLAWAESEAT
jgi:hypothetical protein